MTLRTRDELARDLRSATGLADHEINTFDVAADVLEKHGKFGYTLTEHLDILRRHKRPEIAALAIEALQWDFKARGHI